MDSGEEISKPSGSSLLESMLTLDSGAQLPRPSQVLSTSQAPAQVFSKIWGMQGTTVEDASSGASNVTVKLPISTASTSFGVLGSGSLNLKRSIVGRPVKTDLSVNVNRMLVQRKNPSVKLKHLGSSVTSVFGGAAKGLKKVNEEGALHSPSLDSEPVASLQQDSNADSSANIHSGGNGSNSSGSGGGASGPSSIGGADNELELIEETWPGKVCAFCNLGERSQLGQGEMLRLEVSPDFENLRQGTLHSEERLQSMAANVGAGSNKNGNLSNSVSVQPPSGQGGINAPQTQPTIKKPRLTLKGRRTSSFDASQTCSELQEELNAVGYIEEPDLLGIVEPCGYFYAHRMCATWSKGVTVVNSDGLSIVASSPQVTGADTALIRAASLRCHLCGSFGASLSCQQVSGGESGNGTSCPKSFHFPCAVSCGVRFISFFFFLNIVL